MQTLEMIPNEYLFVSNVFVQHYVTLLMEESCLI